MMNQAQAHEAFTLELAKHPSLHSTIDTRNWVLRFDKSKTHAGTCHNWTRTITLSLPYIEIASDEDILDTIRHELAHALAGASHGHDNVWTAFCALTGAKPLRCGKVETVGKTMREKHAKVTVGCMDCDYVYHYMRMPKLERLMHCSHTGCQHKPNKGRIKVLSMK